MMIYTSVRPPFVFLTSSYKQMFRILKNLNNVLAFMGILALSGCILTESPPERRNKSGIQNDASSTDIGENDAGDTIDAIACTLDGNECKSQEKANQISTCSSESLTCLFRCIKDYRDCDGIIANGCETHLGDVENCGTCANSCVYDTAHFARICVPDANASVPFKCRISLDECEEGFERVDSGGIITCVAPE